MEDPPRDDHQTEAQQRQSEGAEPSAAVAEVSQNKAVEKNTQTIVETSRSKRRWDSLKSSEVSNPVVSVATVVIALATIIYSGFAIAQWKTMEESNGINREALESVQRAFVQWDGFNIVPSIKYLPPGTERFISVQNSWSNNGSTPAGGVIHYFHIEALPSEPDEAQFEGGVTRLAEITYIGPKGTISAIDEEPFSFYVGNSPLRATVESKRKIFFWGWIVYRDAFQEAHVTEVCKVLKDLEFSLPNGRQAPPLSSMVASNPGVAMVHADCNSYNCVDRYCPDYGALVKLEPKKTSD